MPAVKRERADRGVPSYSKAYGYEEIIEQSQAPEEVEEPTPAPPRRFPYISENTLNPLLLVILNICLSSAGTALATQYIGDEISAVQTEAPEEYWWYVVPGWKILKALGAWWGGFDGNSLCYLNQSKFVARVHTNCIVCSNRYQSFDVSFSCPDDAFPCDVPSFTFGLCPRIDDCHFYPELVFADVPPPIESPHG